MMKMVLITASICLFDFFASSPAQARFYQLSKHDSLKSGDTLHHNLDSASIQRAVQEIRISAFKTDSGDVISFMKTELGPTMMLNMELLMCTVQYVQLLDTFWMELSSLNPKSNEGSGMIEAKNGVITHFSGLDSKEQAERMYATTFFTAASYVVKFKVGRGQQLRSDIDADELETIIKLFMSEADKCLPIIKKINETVKER